MALHSILMPSYCPLPPFSCHMSPSHCIFLTTHTVCMDKKMIFGVYQQKRLNFICWVAQQYSWYLDNTCQAKSYRMDDRFWIHSQPWILVVHNYLCCYQGFLVNQLLPIQTSISSSSLCIHKVVYSTKETFRGGWIEVGWMCIKTVGSLIKLWKANKNGSWWIIPFRSDNDIKLLSF